MSDLDPQIPQSPAATSERPGNTVLLPGQSPDGQYILAVLLKRSYCFADRKRCTRAERDRKIITGDQHYKDPMNSSVQFESDFVPYKLATDVVLNGKAYAPGGHPVQELVATLKINEHEKSIYVVGDRVANYHAQGDPTFSDPKAFAAMDIRYERAYGGVDIYFDRKMQCIYGRNHLGRGYVINNSKEAVDRLALPNIEDPLDRLTPARLCIGHFIHWERQPMPQGFGWFAKHWRPRSLLAGVLPADKKYEEELHAAYSQLVPAEQREMYAQTRLPDMDFRFYNGASPGLALPFLQGTEIVRTKHLAPEGEIAFQLPDDSPRIALNIGLGLKELNPVLQTVMIHMEEREVDIVWRGAMSYPGPDWLPQMRNVEISIQ
jgi:hypothetical protein